MAEYIISAKPIGLYWIEGCIDGFSFQAKVYATGSKFGIESGPVSKLAVWDHSNGRFSAGVIIDYDRGWCVKPETDEQNELLSALLRFLETINTTEKS